MFGLNYLSMGVGGIGAAIVVFGALTAWDTVVDDPAVKSETRLVVEAEAQRRTFDAINAVRDAAERNRAMRHYCIDRGLRFDFGSGECWE